MMIEEQLKKIGQSIPQGVALVAVSKFQPHSAIERAYACGQRAFAESRPQEMAEKFATLSKDIEWHFIGHLQTNKIKMIIQFVSLIQSIDSLKLAEAVSAEAVKAGRVVDVLLQVHIASEQTKQGFALDEICELMDNNTFEPMNGINIVGLMGMATFTNDKNQITDEFRALKELYDRYKFTTLSMGMSDDYPLAIECGSNMIRVGSAIFGSR